MTVGSQLLCHNIPLPAALSTSATLTHSTRSFFSFPQNFSNILRKFTRNFKNKKNLFLSHQVPLISNPYDFSVFSFLSFHRFCSSFMLTSCVLCNTSHFNWHHFRIPIPARFLTFFYAFLAKIIKLFNVTIQLKITLKWSSTLNWIDFFLEM